MDTNDIEIISATREYELRDGDYHITKDLFVGNFRRSLDTKEKHFKFLIIEDDTAYSEWEDNDLSEDEQYEVFSECLDNRRDYLESFGYIYRDEDGNPI
tara:strand:+ start:85 stop:381 length:297 start_codon:yes stop_codon:yes gene_type:complete